MQDQNIKTVIKQMLTFRPRYGVYRISTDVAAQNQLLSCHWCHVLHWSDYWRSCKRQTTQFFPFLPGHQM